MTKPPKALIAHEEAKSYNRIKSKHVIEYLYEDFVPWHTLPDFRHKLDAPNGTKIELKDDPAVIVGVGTLKGTNQKMAVIAQQTPSNDEERAKFNYGLVKADGYGLCYNMMEYAENNGLMLNTFIDTVGGDPYEYSAEKLQSWLISYCQSKMIGLQTKSISVVLGLGGSGGAIAIQLAHKRLMLSRAEYSVITAEGCSAILFRSADRVVDALQVLQPTAEYMKKYGIIDDIIKEPVMDRLDYLELTIERLKKAIIKSSKELEHFDVKYLKKNLQEKIDMVGNMEQDPSRYRGIAKKIKASIQSYFAKPATPDVSEMQIALYGSEPYFCNDEKDGEGKTIRYGCRKQFTREEIHNNISACPDCFKPETLNSDEYLEFLIDDGSFREIRDDLTTDHIDSRFKFYDYSSSREKAGKRTDSKDSLVIGYGHLNNYKVAVAVCDFRFMGGSMSAVFGEKMKLIVDHAIKRNLPLITITASGGARMQEGTVALYQMGKTISSILKLKEAGLPHISILGHPTTGGALASYAVQGDFIISERKSTIAFAGDRVVKLTSGGRGVDPEIMTSEFYEKHGGIHLVTERNQFKSVIAGVLHVKGFKVAKVQNPEKEFNEDWY